jgi:hypothetical protein
MWFKILARAKFPCGIWYATVKYEMAVYPFSCDRVETEKIYVSSTTKHNILSVAPFHHCLKCLKYVIA